MSNFIKLSGLIINSLKISRIEIHESKYCIYLMSDKIDGFFLFSNGFIRTNLELIEVCKVAHKTDYNMLTKWINRIE
jgi:hypothetical protein